MSAIQLREKSQSGIDAFGPFKLHRSVCTNCHMSRALCVSWDLNKLTLPEGIDRNAKQLVIVPTGSTIEDHALGINCGCYAKFHRQITHISSRRKANA